MRPARFTSVPELLHGVAKCNTPLRHSLILAAFLALGACTESEPLTPLSAPQDTLSSGDLATPGADARLDIGDDASSDTVIPDAPPTVSPLTVATWNIEQFPKSSQTISTVATLITDNGFDLVALQEVSDPSALDALLDALPGYSGVLNEDADNFLRVGLVYRTERLSLQWSSTVFSDDKWAFPRPPLIAKLEAPRSDGSVAFDFVAVVLHLKAQVDPESEERRRLACVKLDQWLAQQTTFGDEQDYIVLGDWNDRLEDPPPGNVFGPLLSKTDSYVFLTQAAVGAGDVSFLPFPAMIDHTMITRDALSELNGGVTQVLRFDRDVEGYEDTVSDHLPVVTTFELR